MLKYFMAALSLATPFFLLLAAVFPPDEARAGRHDNAQVGIRYATPEQFGEAHGSLQSASSAPDERQEIGCWVHAQVGGAEGARCWAADAEGRWVECQTSDVALVRAAAAVHEGSHVQFTFEYSGLCAAILVRNSSRWRGRL